MGSNYFILNLINVRITNHCIFHDTLSLMVGTSECGKASLTMFLVIKIVAVLSMRYSCSTFRCEQSLTFHILMTRFFVE